MEIPQLATARPLDYHREIDKDREYGNSVMSVARTFRRLCENPGSSPRKSRAFRVHAKPVENA